MATMKELFDAHVTEGNVIPTKAVPLILKEMGLKSVKEVDILEEIDADGTYSKFQYMDLLNYYYQKLREENAAEEIVAVIHKHYPSSKESGTLTTKEMRDVVEKLGPKLSEDEVTEILNELDVQGKGQISVSLFAESMMKF